MPGSLDILEFMKDRDAVSPKDIMNRFQCSRHVADWHLQSLVSAELSVREGRGVYTITDSGVRKLLSNKRL
jgi:predicted transcriptional regulator